MTDYREDLKAELQRLGKSQADLARTTGIPYKRLQGFFCRYWFVNHDEERKVREVLSLWNDEKQAAEVKQGATA